MRVGRRLSLLHSFLAPLLLSSPLRPLSLLQPRPFQRPRHPLLRLRLMRPLAKKMSTSIVLACTAVVNLLRSLRDWVLSLHPTHTLSPHSTADSVQSILFRSSRRVQASAPPSAAPTAPATDGPDGEFSSLRVSPSQSHIFVAVLRLNHLHLSRGAIGQ